MRTKKTSLFALMLFAWVAVSCADLVVMDVTLTPPNPTTGTEITFGASVVNIGNITARPTTMEFRVGGETTGEVYEIPRLSPGQRFRVERTLTLGVAQNYRNTLTVDYDNDVSEFREYNNVFLQHYTVAKAIDYTVGVYYYPWHHNNFHGGQYLREHLVPPQLPELGEYDDRDGAVIGQHLEWSRFAGIDFWVASWWGPGTVEDVTLLDHIFTHPDLGEIKVALFYETTGRTFDFSDYSNLGPDLTYIADNYFDHPNYLKVDGKPVLFVYLTRVLSGQDTLAASLTSMRDAATAAGYELYIVGDQVFGAPPSSAGDIPLLDAVTNYDVYGSMGATGYATQSSVDSYYGAQAGWKTLGDGSGAGFIPATTAGFNDKGVRDGHAPLSRKLTEGDAFGSLFRAMVTGAKELVDPGLGNMLMVTSWNEWHEDTQIEPVAASPPVSTDDSPTGSDYTTGLSYEGYDMRYLQILKEETGN